MDCEAARAAIEAEIDAELELADRRSLTAHLQDCTACREHADALRTLSRAVRMQGRKWAAPEGLAARIDAAIARETPPRPAVTRPRRNEVAGWRQWLRPASLLGSALAGAALALTLTVGFHGGDGGNGSDIRDDEVVAAHLRSLMVDHLTDVPSSDQHTVRPWFDGKVDVAPPTPDLSAEGFTLVGGRLDFLDGRPVAAVVYRRGAHVVNVFVLPDPTPGDAPPRLRQDRGYAIVTWRAGGLALTAVSDVAASDLLRLPSLLTPPTHEPGT